MWFIMSTKIQRYDLGFVFSLRELGLQKEETGDLVYVEHLIEFAKQFPKNSDVRCELLDALGVVDED